MSKFLSATVLSLTLISCEQKKQIIDKDEERLDKVCDTFMLFFSKGQFNEALQLLKQNSVIEHEKIDTLQVTIENHSQNVFPTYGKMLSNRKINDFIEKRFYILKFEKYPIKFDFTLYKSSNGWTITSFNYNEDLTELL